MNIKHVSKEQHTVLYYTSIEKMSANAAEKLQLSAECDAYSSVTVQCYVTICAQKNASRLLDIFL